MCGTIGLPLFALRKKVWRDRPRMRIPLSFTMCLCWHRAERRWGWGAAINTATHRGGGHVCSAFFSAWKRKFERDWFPACRTAPSPLLSISFLLMCVISKGVPVNVFSLQSPLPLPLCAHFLKLFHSAGFVRHKSAYLPLRSPLRLLHTFPFTKPQCALCKIIGLAGVYPHASEFPGSFHCETCEHSITQTFRGYVGGVTIPRLVSAAALPR